MSTQQCLSLPLVFLKLLTTKHYYYNCCCYYYNYYILTSDMRAHSTVLSASRPQQATTTTTTSYYYHCHYYYYYLPLLHTHYNCCCYYATTTTTYWPVTWEHIAQCSAHLDPSKLTTTSLWRHNRQLTATDNDALTLTVRPAPPYQPSTTFTVQSINRSILMNQ